MVRRTLLTALSGAAATFAQSRPPIPVQALNHMTLLVTDVARSLRFYQQLFGLPVQARQGQTVLLRIAAGPQFIALHPAGRNQSPAIGHFCLATEPFDVDAVTRTLAQWGADKPRVRMRGADLGGAPNGTPEIYFADPDGISVQIQHTSYCGGAGALGEQCPPQVEPSPFKGFLSPRGFHHFQLHVSDEERSRVFYRSLFGEVQGIAFAREAKPAIAHACLSVDRFDSKRALSALTELGVRRNIRINGAGVTFPDPDGIRIRLV
jgi:catechol 2,3-dioxygenase-like lactoylglutathione lyase family enzyme